MDFAWFLKSMTKFQIAGMSIDNNWNGRAQAIIIAQPLFDAGIKSVQIIDHLPNGLTFDRKNPLAIRQMAQ